jgi:hypothetical protein
MKRITPPFTFFHIYQLEDILIQVVQDLELTVLDAAIGRILEPSRLRAPKRVDDLKWLHSEESMALLSARSRGNGYDIDLVRSGKSILETRLDDLATEPPSPISPHVVDRLVDIKESLAKGITSRPENMDIFQSVTQQAVDRLELLWGYRVGGRRLSADLSYGSDTEMPVRHIRSYNIGKIY